MWFSKKMIHIAVVVLILGVLSACGSSSGTKEPAAGSSKPTDGGAKKFDDTLKLGVVGPMSGAAAGWGVTLLGSVELAVEEINGKGGVEIGGKKYELAIEAQDTKYRGPDAAQAFSKLSSQGIKMIIGPIGAPELTAMQPLSTRDKVLLFSDTYSVNAISKDFPLVFHESQGPLSWGESMVKQLKKTWPNVDSVSVVSPNDQGGWDVANADIEAYKKVGFAKIETNYYERGTTDFGPLLTKALASKPAVLELGSSPAADSGAIIKVARQMGYTGVISKAGGPGTAEIINIAGENNLGNFIFYAIQDLDSKIYKDFADRFKKLKGKDLLEIGPEFYLATHILVDAISRAQSVDPEKVAEALRKKDNYPNDFFGESWWGGMKTYGINQELVHPYYLGLYVDGKRQPFVKVTPDKE